MPSRRPADDRKKVSDRYGKQLAQKASDRFCEALVRPKMAAAETRAEPSAVLEFKERPRAAAEAMQSASSGAGTGARWEAIQRLKDDFNRVAAPVRAQLEAKAAPRGVARESLAPGSVRGAVQLAWLIKAIRTPLRPTVIAEVAADPQVERVDLPRRVTADIHETSGVVGAPAYRKRLGRTGKGVTVAIIDSEAFRSHRAFGERVIQKENYTLEPWGVPDEHGTAVAGIVAGEDDKYRGVAPSATVYNYKVLAHNEALNSDDFGGALAIQQALEDGARIANCSWGSGPATDGTSREARACDAAWALGLVIVKSAGNRGPGAGTLTTPADAQGVIVVGATSRTGKALASYSSRGPTSDGRARPHLLAPGGDDGNGIFSCLLSGKFGDTGSGTSYAAPHITGLLALLLEDDPSLNPEQLRERLIKQCRKLDGAADGDQGAGLVGFA